LYSRAMPFFSRSTGPQKINEKVRRRMLRYEAAVEISEPDGLEKVHEVYIVARKGYEALSVKLGSQSYFFGDKWVIDKVHGFLFALIALALQTAILGCCRAISSPASPFRKTAKPWPSKLSIETPEFDRLLHSFPVNCFGTSTATRAPIKLSILDWIEIRTFPSRIEFENFDWCRMVEVLDSWAERTDKGGECGRRSRTVCRVRVGQRNC
jgi:hypothetical protein